MSETESLLTSGEMKWKMERQRIAKTEFDPTIIIKHSYNDSMGVKTERYFISENLLCLRESDCLSYSDDMDEETDPLEFLMTHELSFRDKWFELWNRYLPRNHQCKLMLKKKAISKLDADCHHAKIFIWFPGPDRRRSTDYPHVAAYCQRHQAIKKSPSGPHVFRAASKEYMEGLYRALSMNVEDVSDIVNIIFEMLNVHHVLPKLDVGNLSRAAPKKRKRAIRNGTKKIKRERKKQRTK